MNPDHSELTRFVALGAYIRAKRHPEKFPTKAEFIIEIAIPDREANECFMKYGDSMSKMFLAILNQLLSQQHYRQHPEAAGVH